MTQTTKETADQDIVEKMAADIALTMNGGEWKDGKWYSKGHREAWIKAVQPYADEIERLREALQNVLSAQPIKGDEGSTDIIALAKALLEIDNIARAALKEKE